MFDVFNDFIQKVNELNDGLWIRIWIWISNDLALCKQMALFSGMF